MLYEIDAAPYQAELDRALGALARAEANADAAKIKEQRYQQLISTKRSASRTMMTRWPL
ncbi:hypothetical protein [Verrucomicrobium spinosum]|uniref:hypothetical protein n=1 Tax=Verrucomicrobium spinosum TaxID=2736 RepID=UPI000A4EC602|nr:hypothetical protein [Verrucomicrobium spinosum]